MLFLYVYITLEVLLRILYNFVAFDSNIAIEKKETSLDQALGYIYLSWMGISLYLTVQFHGFEKECIVPCPSYSLFVYIFILFFIGRRAISCLIEFMYYFLFLALCASLLALAIALFPCIILFMIMNARNWEGNRTRNQSQGVIDATPSVKYEKSRFKDIATNCVICLVDFHEGDEVTLLRCDRRHTFHYECIVSWFKSNQLHCPICRVEVNRNQMDLQKSHIESILDGKGNNVQEKSEDKV